MVMIVMMIIVMMIIMMVMMVMMVMVIVVVMVMVVLSRFHGLFFDAGRFAALVLGAQNLLSIRNGLEQLGK